MAPLNGGGECLLMADLEGGGRGRGGCLLVAGLEDGGWRRRGGCLLVAGLECRGRGFWRLKSSTWKQKRAPNDFLTGHQRGCGSQGPGSLSLPGQLVAWEGPDDTGGRKPSSCSLGLSGDGNWQVLDPFQVLILQESSHPGQGRFGGHGVGNGGADRSRGAKDGF